MKPSGFVSAFTAIALVALAAVYGVIAGILQTEVPGMVWISFVVLLLIYLAVHRVLMKAASGKPTRFITVFMAASGVKMLAILLLLLVAAWVDRPDFRTVGLSVAFFYLVFTASEVPLLLKGLKTSPK